VVHDVLKTDRNYIDLVIFLVYNNQVSHNAYHTTHQLNVQRVACLYSQTRVVETVKDFAL